VSDNASEIEQQSTQHRWMADGLLLLTAFLWGSNILVFKGTIIHTDAYAFNALRLIFASVTLGTMAIAESLFWPQCRTRRGGVPWAQVFLFCLLNGVIYLLLFVKGISMTTAGNVALIFASLPMWAAFLSMIFLSERLPSITWMGILITLLGTVIVTTSGSGTMNWGSEYLEGNAYALGATLAWAAATVVSRNILMVLTPLQLAAISALTTTPVHLILFRESLPSAISEATQAHYLAAMVFSGVFSTGIAYATWNAGVRRVGASYASVYQNVVTLIAVVGGWIFLSEQVLLAQIAGGCLTIGGLLLMRRGRRLHPQNLPQRDRSKGSTGPALTDPRPLETGRTESSWERTYPPANAGTISRDCD
jgi:drug/metabolite transporter (DMT)-like permease